MTSAYSSPIRTKKQIGSLLKLRLHWHAFQVEPQLYLTALWWKIRGKRVRAKAQFAPLMVTSPLAYHMWVQDKEPDLPTGSVVESQSIIAVVYGESGASPSDIQITLKSLENEGMPFIFAGELGANVAAQINWTEKLWLMPIAAGDILAMGACNAYSQETLTDTRIVYADDDLLSAKGLREKPHFKPSWNSELFRHFDYLTGSCIVRAEQKDLLDLQGPDWPTQMVRRIAEDRSSKPLRFPYVLHHRKIRPQPQLPPPIIVSDAELPSLSVIIPTRNRVELLRTCIEGLARTDYPDMEILIVDNGSDDPETLAYLDRLDSVRHTVIRAPGPFNFSTLNNAAAKQARGELFCLLNNDIEVVSSEWLRVMAVQAMRPEVGAVGARLYYPDGRIQHAGVVLGICGGAAHAHRLLQPDEEGYHHRHALPQFTSAVTAACLVVKRAHFEAINGLDEENFAVAFNDVDFCMRLNAQGWQSLYEPRATLIHHESVSRGFDRDPVGAARLEGELNALKKAWGTDEVIDVFHHPQLNRFSERFVVQL